MNEIAQQIAQALRPLILEGKHDHALGALSHCRRAVREMHAEATNMSDQERRNWMVREVYDLIVPYIQTDGYEEAGNVLLMAFCNILVNDESTKQRTNDLDAISQLLH